MAKDFVKNKDLYEELVRCIDASIYSMELHGMFEKMVDKFGYNFTYLRSEDRKDCSAFAMMDVYMYWRGFNPKYKNAFAYITQIVKNGYAKGWRKLYPFGFEHSNMISTSHHDLYNL